MLPLYLASDNMHVPILQTFLDTLLSARMNSVSFAATIHSPLHTDEVPLAIKEARIIVTNECLSAAQVESQLQTAVHKTQSHKVKVADYLLHAAPLQLLPAPEQQAVDPFRFDEQLQIHLVARHPADKEDTSHSATCSSLSPTVVS